MRVMVKICGLKTAKTIAAAAAGGAGYIGFNFHEASPRRVRLDEVGALRRQLPAGVKAVALTVDPRDGLIADIARAMTPDLWQLHGEETPARLAEIRERTGIPAMKVIALAEPGDLAAARPYEAVADMLLFDTKVPKGAMPGGTGRAFDWTILAGFRSRLPWFLAGGLRADNLAEAVKISGARMVDVSSGVERAPGEKDEGLIRTFLDSARHL